MTGRAWMPCVLGLSVLTGCLATRTGTLDDVDVRQRVAIFGDDDAGAAAHAAAGKDGKHRRPHLFNDGNAH